MAKRKSGKLPAGRELLGDRRDRFGLCPEKRQRFLHGLGDAPAKGNGDEEPGEKEFHGMRVASEIVWLDCLITNVDRTARNTNMLMWYRELWLIDHGAALYFHHQWDNWKEQSEKPFVQVKDHVLLPKASELLAVDLKFKSLLTLTRIREIISMIPDSWLEDSSSPGKVEEKREVYFRFLLNRLEHSEIFIKEAMHARETLV